MSLKYDNIFESFGGVKRKKLGSEVRVEDLLPSQPISNYNLNQSCINKIFKNIMDFTYRIFKSKSDSGEKDDFNKRCHSFDVLSNDKAKLNRSISVFTARCSICYCQNNINSTFCKNCNRALNVRKSHSLENSIKPSTSFKTINYDKIVSKKKKELESSNHASFISLVEEDNDADVKMESLSNSPNHKKVILENEEIQVDNKAMIDEMFGNKKEIFLLTKRVYFGTYACQLPKLSIIKYGIKFFLVPSSDQSNENAKFNILLPTTEIDQILAAFENSMGILIIKTIFEASFKIKTALKLDNKCLIYDSRSLVDTHRFIIIEIIEVSSHIKNCIRTLFTYCKNNPVLKEVTLETAYNYLYNASKTSEKMHRMYAARNKYDNSVTTPSNLPLTFQESLTRLKSASSVINIDLDDNHVISLDTATDVILNYPPNDKDVITIYKQDLDCLKEGEYLNDTILGFYLKYIQREVIDFNISSQVYIFNTFFYGKMTKARKEDVNKPLAERYYDRVKNWTKNIDIFEKKFLIIPMNKNYHWFLAIICYPNNVPEVCEIETIESDSPTEQENVKRPCIIYMDSLGAASGRLKLGEPLRHFLTKEWEIKKKNQKKLFTKAVMPDFYVSVPRQTNNSDCGLFVLQYVESFLNDPDFVIERTQVKLNNWFSLSLIHQKRKIIKELIYQLKKNFEKSKLNQEQIENQHQHDKNQRNQNEALLEVEVDPTCEKSKRVKTDNVNNKYIELK